MIAAPLDPGRNNAAGLRLLHSVVAVVVVVVGATAAAMPIFRQLSSSSDGSNSSAEEDGAQEITVSTTRAAPTLSPAVAPQPHQRQNLDLHTQSYPSGSTTTDSSSHPTHDTAVLLSSVILLPTLAQPNAFLAVAQGGGGVEEEEQGGDGISSLTTSCGGHFPANLAYKEQGDTLDQVWNRRVSSVRTPTINTPMMMAAAAASTHPPVAHEPDIPFATARPLLDDNDNIDEDGRHAAQQSHWRSRSNAAPTAPSLGVPHSLVVVESREQYRCRRKWIVCVSILAVFVGLVTWLAAGFGRDSKKDENKQPLGRWKDEDTHPTHSPSPTWTPSVAPTLHPLIVEPNEAFSDAGQLRTALGEYLAEHEAGTLGPYSAISQRYGFPIGVWDVSQIQVFDYLFQDCSRLDTFGCSDSVHTLAFNQDIGQWNVSAATSMISLFQGAAAFNQPLESWDVSRVSNFALTFFSAEAFNQPLNKWNVSNAVSMSYMFSDAKNFNQPLNDWDVSRVYDFSAMFYVTPVFNQPINAWKVSSAQWMYLMFAQSGAKRLGRTGGYSSTEYV